MDLRPIPNPCPPRFTCTSCGNQTVEILEQFSLKGHRAAHCGWCGKLFRNYVFPRPRRSVQ